MPPVKPRQVARAVRESLESSGMRILSAEALPEDPGMEAVREVMEEPATATVAVTLRVWGRDPWWKKKALDGAVNTAFGLAILALAAGFVTLLAWLRHHLHGTPWWQ